MAEIKHATDATFEELVLKAERPVVVDFWAAWCGPCKMVAPEMEKLAEKYDGSVDVVKVDVDANPRLSQAFSIMSIPTIAFFKPGAQPQGVVGFRPLEQLEQQFGLAEFAHGGRRGLTGRLAGPADPDPGPRPGSFAIRAAVSLTTRRGARTRRVARSMACSSRTRGANDDPVAAARRTPVASGVRRAASARVGSSRNSAASPVGGRATANGPMRPASTRSEPSSASALRGDALDASRRRRAPRPGSSAAASRIACRSAACSS